MKEIDSDGAVPRTYAGDLIVIANDGPGIEHTNFWDSAMAREGYLFASWNAGTLRLLIPDGMLHAVEEMKTGRCAVVSNAVMNGRAVLRVMFDDDSEMPLSVVVSVEQCDRVIGDQSHGRPVDVMAWGRSGKLAEWPGIYGAAAAP